MFIVAQKPTSLPVVEGVTSDDEARDSKRNRINESEE